jgi:hypothetical protein
METELLSNKDLEYYAHIFKLPLNDVLSKDLFKNITPRLGNYIINLEDSIQGGSHWTCLILTKDIAIYWDSFGAPIPQDILKFIKRYNKKITIIYSIDQIQHMSSIYCGWFCIWFLLYMTVLRKTVTNYRYLLNRHNALFDLEKRKKNDQILKELIKNYIIKYNLIV